MRMTNCLTSLALAGALLAGAVYQSSAAAVLASTTALKSAAPDAIADVRWGRGWGWHLHAWGWRGGYGYRPYYRYRSCVTHEGYRRFNPCDH
jgi:hypothetical protein